MTGLSRARLLPSLLLALWTVPPAPASAAKITLKPQHDGGVTVLVDGLLFTEYWIKNGAKPILFPVIGPNGTQMTRDYPMKYVDGEKHDHPHQRSLWFTHGNVNGIDFWSEVKQHGWIRHREFVRQEAKDDTAVIETINDWLDHDGQKQLEDQRRLTFRADEVSRTIDFDITLKATAGPVKFGDTKEGAFAIRVPTALDVDPEKGKPRPEGEGGHILTSEGLADKDAWGKPAKWVDYYGLLNGQVVGVAILNHPSSFRFPTHWHVRTYGLFAANPFGLHDFQPSAGVDGAHTLAEGQSLDLRYRVVFHLGDAKQAGIEAAFERYAAETK